MRKVLFLMFLLLLMGLGAAGVKAQVRIGGNGAPNAAAVLDLNATDDATPTGNKGALALPRVSLSSTTAQLNGATPVTGMLVYNTNAAMTGGNGAGVYLWDGTHWFTVVQTPSSRPNSVVWAIVYDSTLTLPGYTGAGITTQCNTPGTQPGDVCLTADSHAWGMSFTAFNGVTEAVHLSTIAGGPTVTRLVCYRAYKLN